MSNNKDFLIDDKGEITNCIANHAKMNTFEYINQYVKWWKIIIPIIPPDKDDLFRFVKVFLSVFQFFIIPINIIYSLIRIKIYILSAKKMVKSFDKENNTTI